MKSSIRLLVRGPSVFSGYLAYDGPDPFLTVNEHRWYYTSDLVQLDDEGFIHFRGRLKRFLKAGGEMLYLPALEEPLPRLHPPTENGPQVAIEGIETPAGHWIVLFTTRDLALRQASVSASQPPAKVPRMMPINVNLTKLTASVSYGETTLERRCIRDSRPRNQCNCCRERMSLSRKTPRRTRCVGRNMQIGNPAIRSPR